MSPPDALRIAVAVRQACVLAALDGYERALIAGLCREGAWEAAVDAIRMIELTRLLDPAENEADPRPPHRGTSSA